MLNIHLLFIQTSGCILIFEGSIQRFFPEESELMNTSNALLIALSWSKYNIIWL